MLNYLSSYSHHGHKSIENNGMTADISIENRLILLQSYPDDIVMCKGAL